MPPGPFSIPARRPADFPLRPLGNYGHPSDKNSIIRCGRCMPPVLPSSGELFAGAYRARRFQGAGMEIANE